MILRRVKNFVRDFSYNVVSKEGGFTLHFFADFFRGHTRHSDNAQPSHSQPETPLNYEERKVFNELLARNQGEDQVAYWKRKKAMLALPDKKRLVAQEMDARKQQAKQDKLEATKLEVQALRKAEATRKRIEQAKYSSIGHKR